MEPAAGASIAHRLLRLAFATLYFMVITVALTWPLTSRMCDSVVGQIGDNVYFVWLIGWFEESLFHLHVSPIHVPFLNHPEGWHLASNEITPAMVLTGLPISIFLGPIAGYNFAVLSSFVFSGLALYVWVLRLTRSHIAGLVAGTIFAFSPYRMSHYLAGHLNLLGTHWFPLYFMALTDLLGGEIGRRPVRPILATAAFLGLIGLTSQYYLYMTLVVSCVYVLGHMFFVDGRAMLNVSFWRRLAATGLTALPLIAFAIYPFLTLAREGNITPRPLEYARVYSASPTDFILPATMSMVWGSWVGAHFDRSLWIEASLYLGVVGSTLAVFGWLRRNQVPAQRGLINQLALFGAGAILLAMGTDLKWLSRPVMVSVPEFLLEWHPNPMAYIPLPGRFLFYWLPYYSWMRVLMRYGVFAILAVAILAGLGAKLMLSKIRRRWAGVLGWLVLGLVMLDFLPKQQPLTRLEARPVDYWLAAQPGDGAVAQFPFSQVGDQEQIYYTRTHGKPFVGAFFNAFPSPQYQRIRPTMETFPSPESMEQLRALGIQFVIVDSSSYAAYAQVHERACLLGLKFRLRLGTDYVYEVPDAGR